jgi:hypothetical protein
MFRNGIYKVCYRSPHDDDDFSEHALAVLRDGQIIGSDRLGGVFTGAPRCGSAADDCISVDLTVPPGGELVNGFVAGPAGATIQIKTRLDPEKIAQVAVIDVAGEPVEIQLIYLGPLPE